MLILPTIAFSDPSAGSATEDGRRIQTEASPTPDAKKDTTRDTARGDQRDGTKKRERKRAPKTALAATRAKGSTPAGGCSGGLERLPETGFCTHGPDPAPPGLKISRRVQPLAATREIAGLSCDGNGVSGYRVQVLYVRSSGSSDRYSQYLPSIRAWTAGADAIMQASAAETGGTRHFRFVTNGSCQLDVTPVTVSAAEIADFGKLIDALWSRGYTRSDRFYLSFVDSTNSGYCGVATYWGDDRASSNNNNSGPAYSRVDAGCWSEAVVAHELMHNLGSVQRSAPHSTPYGHCIDEWDVMCYQDSSSVTMQTICPSSHGDRYDCNHDDYFHTSPPAGSYLATHWNTANSQFLVSSGGNSGGDNTAPSVTISQPRRGAKPKGKKTITILANASDSGSGVAMVEFRRCDGHNCVWAEAKSLASDTTAPFTARWKLPKRGTVTFVAQAIDVDGNVGTSQPVTIRVKKKR